MTVLLKRLFSPYNFRRSFLEQHGFHEGGGFSEVNMMRSLQEPIPDPLIPAGFQVRPLAETGEISTRADVPRRDPGMPSKHA